MTRSSRPRGRETCPAAYSTTYSFGLQMFLPRFKSAAYCLSIRPPRHSPWISQAGRSHTQLSVEIFSRRGMSEGTKVGQEIRCQPCHDAIVRCDESMPWNVANLILVGPCDAPSESPLQVPCALIGHPAGRGIPRANVAPVRMPTDRAFASVEWGHRGGNSDHSIKSDANDSSSARHSQEIADQQTSRSSAP